MELISLEGNTLGQKHLNYNSLVKIAAADETYKLSEINFHESDLNNLLRIDVACIRREVEYLLHVLQCQDMLYVFRAVKGSVWLVTEEQYSNIINPAYLDKELLPNMTTKAKKKLLTSIRNNLKDAARVENFFNYYKDNFFVAQHWLRHCSIDFIQDIVVKHADEISANVIKHLCRKSSKILKCYLNIHSRDSTFLHRYLLQAEREEAIKLMDLIYSNNQRKPNFRKRFTRSLMKRYPDVMIKNFQTYCYGIHIPTFVKYMDKEKIENILLSHTDNDFMKKIFVCDNLKHFIRYMPEINRLQLIKTMLLETEKPSFMSATCFADLRAALGYSCYEFVPFNFAFLELKNAILTESSSYKIKSILNALANSARGNPHHIQTLLEFYRSHITAQSVEDKVQFLNKLIFPSILHRLNAHIWAILEEIFISMDLSYADTSKDLPKCLVALIIYKVIHDKQLPEVLKNKVKPKSFLDFRYYLGADEQRKVFDYVYESFFAETCKKDIVNEGDMHVFIDEVVNVLILLKDWNKGPDDYSWVINKIGEIIKTKNNKNSWNCDLSALLHFKELLTTKLYEELLILYPNDEMCVHVLKHDTCLLLRQMDVLVDKCSNDSISLKRTLGKLRVYWPKTTVQQWIDSYLKRLHRPVGQKTVVESLCILLPQKEAMIILIKKYAPRDNEFEHKESEIGLQQNIARCLHLIRPSVDWQEVVMYANNECLRYMLPSLDVILRNQSPHEFWSGISLLLTHETLRKYAARMAISVLKKNAPEVYNRMKFSFVLKLRDILYKENDASTASEIWDLLIKVYDDLLPDERVKADISMFSIYYVQGPQAIQLISFIKLYQIYKLYGPQSKYAEELAIKTADELFDYLEPSFIENEMIKISTEHILGESGFDQSISFLSKYILNCDCEKKQVVRYEQILMPILHSYFASWEVQECDSHWCYPACPKHKIYKILSNFLYNFFSSITTSKYPVPVQLSINIKNKLEKELNTEEELNTIITWNLTVIFLEKIRDHIEFVSKVFVNEEYPYDEWNRFCLDIVKSVAEAWLLYFQPILSLDCGSLHVIVSRACLNIFETLRLYSHFKLSFVKSLLAESNDPSLYYIAIDILRHVSLDRDNISRKNPLSDAVNMEKELIEKIRSYPSVEVQIYYNHYSNYLMSL